MPFFEELLIAFKFILIIKIICFIINIHLYQKNFVILSIIVNLPCCKTNTTI